MAGPSCENIEFVARPAYRLSHAIWRNELGSYEPETGIRYLDRPSHGGFYLVQHGWDDWPRVTAILDRCIERGWGYWRICRLFEGRAFKARLAPIADAMIEARENSG